MRTCSSHLRQEKKKNICDAAADLSLKHRDGLQVLLLAVDLLLQLIDDFLLSHQRLLCGRQPLLKVIRDLLLHQLRLEDIYLSAITANRLLVFGYERYRDAQTHLCFLLLLFDLVVVFKQLGIGVLQLSQIVSVS